MAVTVPSQEGHAPTRHIPHHHVIAGVTERRGDVDAL
jgi:hypothetical protein